MNAQPLSYFFLEYELTSFLFLSKVHQIEKLAALQHRLFDRSHFVYSKNRDTWKFFILIIYSILLQVTFLSLTSIFMQPVMPLAAQDNQCKFFFSPLLLGLLSLALSFALFFLSRSPRVTIAHPLLSADSKNIPYGSILALFII